VRPRFAFIALALGASTAALSQEPAARVTVHVAIEDASGQPVRGVAAASFSLDVDGAAHPIESVVPEAQPLSVILLADLSPSVNEFAGRLNGAARDFVEGLDAADRWRTGTFADRILFSRAFASGRASFRPEPRDPIVVRERGVRGGSPVWDALYQSVELLAEAAGRRSVVVFTDGRASGNDRGLDDVAEFAIDHAVSVSAVVPLRSFGVRQDRATVALISPAAGLDRLTRYTGGVLLGGYDHKDDPLRRLRALAARLRAGYALTFAIPKPDARRHRLDVRVTGCGVQVRAPTAFRTPDR
jgi:hypothetical protein